MDNGVRYERNRKVSKNVKPDRYPPNDPEKILLNPQKVGFRPEKAVRTFLGSLDKPDKDPRYFPPAKRIDHCPKQTTLPPCEGKELRAME